MESPDPAREAGWTPPRFDLSGPAEERAPRSEPPRPRPARRRALRPAARAAVRSANGRAAARHRNIATVLGLVFLIAAACGLIALAAMAMPQILGLAAVVLGFFVFGAVHYLLWGWWLGAAGAPPPADDEAA